MAVSEITASWRATCDCCKVAEVMPAKGRPKYWSDFQILRYAYDFQGYAVADGSLKLLLCLTCSDATTKAINTTFDEIQDRAAISRAISPSEGG